MHANLLLTIASGKRSRELITKLLKIEPTKTRRTVKSLLMSRGWSKHDFSENEMSQWQLEASSGSGQINHAIKRIMSRLPRDFPKRLEKLPKSHICLSIAVLAPTDSQGFTINNENLAKLNAIGASLQVLIFSQKELAAWNDL